MACARNGATSPPRVREPSDAAPKTAPATKSAGKSDGEKCAAANVAALSARVKALHSYDVPCVAEIPLGGGNADYFDWIVAESGGGETV